MVQPIVTQAYQESLARLNPEQRLAVETIEGPVMVLAGPGTGKTEVLVTRIAHILSETDVEPGNILALTYTEAAATNMRKRLVNLIGPVGYQVKMSTFHALCTDIIQDNPEHFEIKSTSEPISELENQQILMDILDAGEYPVLKPPRQQYHNLKSIEDAISALKKESILPASFADILEEEAKDFLIWKDEPTSKGKPKSKNTIDKRERSLQKNQELLRIYREYEIKLRENGFFDFDDMINFVVNAFQQNQALLQEYQEKYQYILVDEYQDTNSSQDEIIHQLTQFWGEAANVFVVGDPNQSIFRFQGASIENTLRFLTRYPQATQIQLKVGYRCPPNLYLAAATSLQAGKQVFTAALSAEHQNLTADLFTPLTAIKKQNSPIELWQTSSPITEAWTVADSIEQLVKQGSKYSEIAVLYPKHALADPLEQVLRQRGIPYTLKSDGNLLHEPFFQQVLAYLEWLSGWSSGFEPQQVDLVLQLPWLKLPGLTVVKLSQLAAHQRQTVFQLLIGDLWRQNDTESDKSANGLSLSKTEVAQVQAFIDQTITLSQTAAVDPVVIWLETVWRETGLMEWVKVQSNRIWLLNQLQALYEQAKTLSSRKPLQLFLLQDLLAAIKVMKDSAIPLRKPLIELEANAVMLSTVHGAKGLEWNSVFLIRAVEDAWQGRGKNDQIALPARILSHITEVEPKVIKEADQRRNWYVAMTRAKEKLFILHPEFAVKNGEKKAQIMTVLASELAPAGVEPQVLPKREDIEAQLEQQFMPKHSADLLFHMLEPDILRNLISRFRLSATALNNYLESPAKFVWQNLIKVPQAKPANLCFGSAVHGVMEKMAQTFMQTKEIPAESEWVRVFEQSIGQQLLTKKDYLHYLQYGKRIISDYYQKNGQNWAQPLAIEKSFGGSYPILLDDTYYLRGRIDKLDLLDKSGKVRVTDYKTGRPKSRKEIEGLGGLDSYSARELALPPTIRGRLKRQLIFYQLLTDLDPVFSRKYRLAEAVLEFVEPDKGVLKSELFTITLEEVEDLKQLIRTVMQEIKALTFLESIPLAAKGI